MRTLSGIELDILRDLFEAFPGYALDFKAYKHLSAGGTFLLGSSEEKITIGLSHLAALIDAAIRCREWRIFGHPPVIWDLTELAKLGGDSIRPAETKLAEKIAARVAENLRENPLDAVVVGVTKSGGKSIRNALKNPGGRPAKATRGAESYSQKAFAEMLNAACSCKNFTEDIVHDWEHNRTNPPTVFIDGQLVAYTAEIRNFPNRGNNRKILEAIITELRTGHYVANSVLQKNTRHCRTDETLARASDQIATAVRTQARTKYGK